jgi:hypothetical protein
MKATKFALGSLVATPAALEALKRAGQSPAEFLSRHAAGDWGDVSKGDARLNDAAVRDGERILSAYRTLKGERLWIITEADHCSTCILLPDEY